MEISSREKILEILKHNNLSAEDLVLWEQVLIGIPENFRVKFEDFFNLYPDAISFSTQVIKEQKDALISGNQEKLEDIFKKIKEYLGS
jgi:hypothetical protein